MVTRRRRRSFFAASWFSLGALALLLYLVGLGCSADSRSSGGAGSSGTQGSARVEPAVHFDQSPPLRDMAPAPRSPARSYPALRVPRPAAVIGATEQPAPARGVRANAPTTMVNVNGVGNGFTGPAGTFSVASAPPDPNGDVGPNHFVEIVNTDIAVFNKSGTAIFGPVPTNTLFNGFGGGCQTNDDGDGEAIYDPIADRWIITQFSVSTTPNLQCVAVSQSPDPTGAYNRYSFSYTDFPDYPKLSVWPDAYYATFNMFSGGGSAFAGGEVCAYDRAKMLAGQAATQQCFSVGTSFGGLLAGDLDGTTLPPTGAPNPVIALGSAANQLAFWKFHVDWTTPANTTLTGPTTLATSAFAEACGGGTCIPQTGTTEQLDSLADRLMYRNVYRNFGDHQSLVVNHSITAGSGVGLRWYELRLDASGNPSIFQQGTYAPDSNFRWMGSIAMDKAGDMALGFSLSGSTLHPEIHYTGRLAGDPAGQMPQGEGTILNGAGSQGTGLSRWGDYTSMMVDPSDDCTFWYTNQYIPADGTFNWATRIASFKFPSCGGTVTNDFSISLSPTSISVAHGASGTSTVSTAVTSGSAESIALSVSGLPTGATASFSPTSVTSGGSSTLTVNVGATVTPGTYMLTVTGTATSGSHTATLALTVPTPVTNDFSISLSPTALTVAQGASGTDTVSTAVTSGSAESISLSASGLPTGATASFSPTSVTSGGSSTLTISVGASVTPGTYTVTVTGTATSGSHNATLTLTVPTPVTNDFSLSLSPTSLTITQGASGTDTVSTAVTSGSAETVSLSATGLPSGVTASFSPTSVTSGGSSTLTLTASATATTGTATVTVTGTAASGSHGATLSLTVNPATTGGGIVNGGFETGNLTGWTSTGTTAVVSTAHSGSFAARVGSTSPSHDSSIAQTFTVPTGDGSLSFFYQVHCPDTLQFDWATATLKDNTAGTTATVLAKTCTNSGTWKQATAHVVAGHSYTLTLSSHDDNFAGDPTFTLYDDVTLVAAPPPPPPGITNGGFETGSLSGWTSSGSTSVVSTAHSGSFAAQVGSTSPSNDSSLAQSFTAPSGVTKLVFWYQVHCPDTLQFDWATATLADLTTGTTTTVLAKTCTNAGAWVQASATIVAGHAYTLTLSSHDDNFAGDPTFTLYDDVALQ
jgi:hypothetical protein